MKNTYTTLQQLPPEIPVVTVLYADKTKEKINEIFASIWAKEQIDFGRKWWTIIHLEWDINVCLIKGKWPESTDIFWWISDFVITGTDIGKKIQTLQRWQLSTYSNLSLIWRTSGKEIWGSETYLGLLIPQELLSDKDFDIQTRFFPTIVTKYGPIITRNVLEELWLDPEIIEVDSNSELCPQVLAVMWKTQVWVVEIVQSGASVEETINYVIRPTPEGKVWIYEVIKGDKKTATYRLVQVLLSTSPISMFAEKIYSQIDLWLYENENISSAKWSLETALLKSKLLRIFI